MSPRRAASAPAGNPNSADRVRPTTPCADTARLLSQAACDAATVMNICQKLIAEGSDAADVLAAMGAIAGRIGMVCDLVAVMNGGQGWHHARAAAAWVMPGGTPGHEEALERVQSRAHDAETAATEAARRRLA